MVMADFSDPTENFANVDVSNTTESLTNDTLQVLTDSKDEENNQNSESGDKASFDCIWNNWKRFVLLHHETRFNEEYVDLFLFVNTGFG